MPQVESGWEVETRTLGGNASMNGPDNKRHQTDAYFSVDIETDGPIPGPFSMLSFAIVYAGSFDGKSFHKPDFTEPHFYAELKPISETFEPEALKVNGLDRKSLVETGRDPSDAMDAAYAWVMEQACGRSPVLVAYPVSFDWSWLYWYFIAFSRNGSPFGYSRCFDIKTAFATKAHETVAMSGRSRLPADIRSKRNHSHHALDDAREQAEIFSNLFAWNGKKTQ